MERKRGTGLLLALILIIYLSAVNPTQAAQLYLYELFQSYPNLHVWKEGTIVRTVKLELKEPEEQKQPIDTAPETPPPHKRTLPHPNTTAP